MSSKSKIIGNIIFGVVITLIIVIFYCIFERYNFNDYEKSEYYANKTKFTRDSNEKYEKNISYKLQSKEFNDAIFYKTIKVQKHTVYKVTCMVKTENIQTEKDSSIAGAQISIVDTTEKSKSIKDTNNWQKIELLFDSKNREQIKIGFRLGGYDDNCKGTAWFANFEIESGVQDTSANWNFALFICENLDVNIKKDGTKQNIKISMTNEDIQIMTEDIERFKKSIRQLSGNKMTAKTNIYEVKTPITTLSYDVDNGYYVGVKDVENIIDDVVSQNEFDHIFIAIRFGDILKSQEVPVNDWIGLGYMDYYGIGFSNIRLPNSSGSYTYRYNPRINTFPEEVFVHEFLHSLERQLNERNYEIPELHSYAKYGYNNNNLEGLKSWYEAYMQKKIKTTSGYIGLDSDVYNIKPVKRSCFEYSTKLDYFEEPKTIFGQIAKTISTIF